MTLEICEEIPQFISRKRLPDTRGGKTVKLRLFDEYGEEVDVFFTVNTYVNGYPGELWLWMGKEGSDLHGFANCWATSISMMLQYGINPEDLYNKFIGQRFNPSGVVGQPWCLICTSVVDAVMKYMKATFPPTCKVLDSYNQTIEDL